MVAKKPDEDSHDQKGNKEHGFGSSKPAPKPIPRKKKPPYLKGK